MCGLSHSDRYNADIPTWNVYQDVMELLSGESQSDRGKKNVAKYRERIIGKTCLVQAPSRYHEIGAVHDMGITPELWASYSIHARAELMARRYIKNMIEVIDAFYKEKEDAKKRDEERRKKSVPLENDSGE